MSELAERLINKLCEGNVIKAIQQKLGKHFTVELVMKDHPDERVVIDTGAGATIEWEYGSVFLTTDNPPSRKRVGNVSDRLDDAKIAQALARIAKQHI